MTTRSSDANIISLWLARQPSPATRACYRSDAGRLLAHARKPLARLTLADLQSFDNALARSGLAPSSRARTLAAAKSLLGFCHRMRYIPANPAAELVLPRYENRLAERILGEDDVRRMIAAERDPRNQTLLRLLYAAGLRVSEACHLLWRNLRPRGDAGQITAFGKNGRTRAIALPAALWSDLAALRGDAGAEEPVFPSRSGKPLDRGRVRTIVRQAAERAGVAGDVSPHWLRHAHASHALDHGAPIHLVQATLGHSSVATTSRYLHARPGDSSARFLALEGAPAESSRIALLFKQIRGMDVMTAAPAAQGDYTMTSNAEEQANTQGTATAPVAEPKHPKASKKPAGAPQKPRVAPAKGKSGKKTTPAKQAPKSAKAAKPAAKTTGGARPGSKTAKVLELLKRPNGATLKELMKATSWQPHSVRGFLSGTVGKKMGLALTSTKGEDGERSYSIKG